MLSYMAIGLGEPREVTRGRMVEVRTNSRDEDQKRLGWRRPAGACGSGGDAEWMGGGRLLGARKEGR